MCADNVRQPEGASPLSILTEEKAHGRRREAGPEGCEEQNHDSTNRNRI